MSILMRTLLRGANHFYVRYTLIPFVSEQKLARVELHKDSITREVDELSQLKEDLTVELASLQKEKEIQV